MNAGAVANWLSLLWIASHPIVYPVLGVLQIVGIALLVGWLFLWWLGVLVVVYGLRV